MAVSPRRAYEDWRTGGSGCCDGVSHALADARTPHLETQCEELEDGRLAGEVERRDGRVETLRQAGEEIERDDEERLVRLLVLRRVGHERLVLDE